MTDKCDDKETKSFRDIKNPYQFFAYLFRYHPKKLLALVVILLIFWILTMNFSYDKKNGLQWRPAAKINATADLKRGNSNNPQNAVSTP